MSDRAISAVIDELLAQERLPSTYRDTAMTIILPLARELQRRQRAAGRTLLVGIHGAQGTGKSTLTLFLQSLLTEHLNCACSSFSLDDIYLTQAERQRLAETVHPLLRTRGVPGTHDLDLGQRLIDQLVKASADSEVAIPFFDKARDDRVPEAQWPRFSGVAAIVLVEGWCLGARPETDPQKLMAPQNELERRDDPDGVWRRYVNHRLDTDYAQFFSQLDRLIMLRAPSMACVLRWRTLQEHKLARRLDDAPERSDEPVVEAKPPRIMTDDQVAWFIMHYERITRRTLIEMPSRADWVIDVNENHGLTLAKGESLL
ncbi:hypothetical protein [Marinobacter sp. SS21]|uniref:hypothetical protein n=1 Tax=Marinobacter sp. SS21 TaxID=2979460 RepID=UPI00232BBA5D|nr:hypothetical protein [Marinobacter sp. SS21]MDC0663825.1 hypothetical protein [Marinobacter sp. SS21]